MHGRLSSLLLCSCLALSCTGATEPWSYLGQWAGTNEQLGATTLRIDIATADSVSGRVAWTGTTSFGVGVAGDFFQGQLYPDSLAFDLQLGPERGFTQIHGRVTRVGNGVSLVLVGYGSVALVRS